MPRTSRLQKTIETYVKTLLATFQYIHILATKNGLSSELPPWMAEFSEHLIGITKESLRKSIGKLLLTSVQLQTVLSGVEAIVNTRTLIYVENKLKPRKIITPMHFLSTN